METNITALLGGKYELAFLVNKEHVVLARLQHIIEVSPRTIQEVGTIVVFYDSTLTAEDHRPHWEALCFISQEHLTDELVDKIGQELLRSARAAKPLLVIPFCRERSSVKSKEYGSVWLDE